MKTNTCGSILHMLPFYSELQQERSYRKQIARQLRTQYVEGICSKPRDLEM